MQPGKGLGTLAQVCGGMGRAYGLCWICSSSRGRGHGLSRQLLTEIQLSENMADQMKLWSSGLQQDGVRVREGTAASELLTRVILWERVAKKEESAKTKHWARQLEGKDTVIKKRRVCSTKSSGLAWREGVQSSGDYNQEASESCWRSGSKGQAACLSLIMNSSTSWNSSVLLPKNPSDPQFLCSGEAVHALCHSCKMKHIGEGREESPPRTHKTSLMLIPKSDIFVCLETK